VCGLGGGFFDPLVKSGSWLPHGNFLPSRQGVPSSHRVGCGFAWLFREAGDLIPLNPVADWLMATFPL